MKLQILLDQPDRFRVSPTDNVLIYTPSSSGGYLEPFRFRFAFNPDRSLKLCSICSEPFLIREEDNDISGVCSRECYAIYYDNFLKQIKKIAERDKPEPKLEPEYVTRAEYENLRSKINQVLFQLETKIWWKK